MLSLVLFLWSALCLAGPSGRIEAPVVADLEAAQELDDPRALRRAASHWLEKGDLELARVLHQRAFEQEEIQRYLNFRPEVSEALILERMGEHDKAAKKWREAFVPDVHFAMLSLRIMSIHPEREALWAEAVADVQDRVERAKKGEQVPIYFTKKGKPRYLEVIPDEQVVDRLLNNDGYLRYCYIDKIDFSEETSPVIPEVLQLNRCVVGSISIPDRHMEKVQLRAIVLGDVDLGKTWAGEPNKSATILASRVQDIMVLESIILGRANFQDVHAAGRNAYFALSVFQGEADFRDARINGVPDLRFSVFGEGANFKGARLLGDALFGESRYLAATTFRGMYSEQDLYFNSTEFEHGATFDKCEWARGATFENSTFGGPVSFNETKMGGRLNMSRTTFEDSLTVKEMVLSGMDLIGSDLMGDASFVDVRFKGKVRFSLDDVTRARYLDDPTPLLSLYRDYQGDKDAEEPLTTKNSYGVETVDDLIARVHGNLSFANSVFEGFVIFERVAFGQPGEDTLAQFYNTQFKGETHFERTEFHSTADFTTIFSNELSFNEALFHRSLVLDDANISGRVTLTDATFAPGADLSFYGAQFATFQIDRAHVVTDSGDHRLFYEACAKDPQSGRGDIRISRALRGEEGVSDEAISQLCYDRVIDEFVSLKQSFGDRAMTPDEDWSYWWIKHHENVAQWTHGGLYDKVSAAVMGWLVFELSFGWGVRLGNLGICVIVITLIFAVIYRVFCPDTIVAYKGDDVPMRTIPWEGLVYISLQTLGAFNTGWDFGEDDWRFQYLNTLQTYLGYIILTFFVGAYTRMILA